MRRLRYGSIVFFMMMQIVINTMSCCRANALQDRLELLERAAGVTR